MIRRRGGHPWLFWVCAGTGVMALAHGSVVFGALMLAAAWRLLVR